MSKRSHSKRQAAAAATSEHLLLAARRVFERKGYQATTVGAITAAADTAHGTFYLYFRNKEDAFTRVLERVTDELFESTATRWDDADPYGGIHRSLRAFVRIFVANRGLWRCTLEAALLSPTVGSMWIEVRRAFIGRIERRLRRLLAEGAIRPLDPALAANALGAMVEWTATTTFVLDDAAEQPSVDDVVASLTELWFRAVFGDVADVGEVVDLAGEERAGEAQHGVGTFR